MLSQRRCLCGSTALGILSDALIVHHIVCIAITIIRYIYAHILYSFVLLRVGVLVVCIMAMVNVVVVQVIVQMVQMMTIHFDVIGARNQCDAHRIEGLLEAKLCVETARCIILGTYNDKRCVAAFNHFLRQRLGQMNAESVDMCERVCAGNEQKVISILSGASIEYVLD